MTNAAENRQFRILHRDFLSRMIDIELISAGGSARDLLIRFAAMLLALGFLISYLMVPRYVLSDLPHARLARFAWGDEEFLISLTIALVSLCAVMTWSNVFPDRRDSLILGLLPIRLPVMMAARFAAIGTVLGGAILTANALTGLAFPLALATGGLDAIGSLITWWLTLVAAGAFTFGAALVLQGVAAQVLPWRVFLRASSLLQILYLFAALAFFFLTPPFDSAKPPAYIPSFWFVGLLHKLRGDTNPAFDPLLAHALTGLAVVTPLAVLVYVLSWSRNMRRIVESPEILPAKRARLANFFARILAPAPFERAILQFTARTIARSRQHRLMLAIYGGFGLSLILVYVRAVLASNTDARIWHRPNPAFLIAGVLLLTITVLAVRAVFAFPLALRSNWIFGITAVHRPAAYFAAVRKSLFVLAALPVWMLTAIWYFGVWPRGAAFDQTLMLVLFGIILVERSLYQFRKIPFTCSWLPGGANRSMKAVVLCLLFLVLANLIMAIELWTLSATARVVVFLGIFAAFAVHSRRRTVEYAADPFNQLQFEDLPPTEIYALDLRQDGAWSGDQAYVEAIDPYFGRSFGARMLPFAIGFLVLLSAGAVYQQLRDWSDRRNFPQIGRSVNIGGRSLNLYCSGQGSPTVIFESNIGAPGYAWAFIQRIAAGETRACWYDRAGYGWSDPGPFPNHSDTIARDLHQLLAKAGEPPPYVLVGHAMGAFHARVFRGYYPNEVAGMVLLDPMSEEFTDDIFDRIDDAVRPAALAFDRVLGAFGFFRLMAFDPGPAGGGLTPQEWSTIAALRLRTESVVAQGRELPPRISGELAVASGAVGDIPVVVLTDQRPATPGAVIEAVHKVVELGQKTQAKTPGPHRRINSVE